ncbi:hypothetical protein [uncultured Chloroflexus sp.]|uniref:hypothetical protein n=1 Tax=uncultured Chloroflexus sp. TaxID=214040 RepID=UPI00261B31B0|nr:hypothetical protein [uncultured Chloroflexus sp.]
MIVSHPRRTIISRHEQFHLAQQALRRLDRGTGLIALGASLIVGAIAALIWLQPHLAPIPASIAINLMTIGIGAACLIAGWRRYSFHRQLRAATAITDAPMIDCWIENAFEGEPGVIAWELVTSQPDGTEVRLRQAQLIDPSLVTVFQRAATVPVRYVPANPTVSALIIE